MMNSLKHAGKNISHGLSRTWDHISEGWHELVHQSSDALTHFAHPKDGEDKEHAEVDTLPAFRNWSILAGEVEETDKEMVVRVEMPGMEKKDCHITIDGNMLHLRGEKHFERTTSDSMYHFTERAYGVFQRTIPLPCKADADHAEASYKNGVLTVRLPKLDGEQGRLIPIS
ncbi:MAG: Hsp20/alpha crystallin family protein [Nitrosospira sp.]